MELVMFISKKIVAVTRVLLVVFFYMLLLSCIDGHGVLFTLATERPRDDRNLSNEATVSAVVKVNERYYVAAHGVWSRLSGSESWRAVRWPKDSHGIELPVLSIAAEDDILCAGTEQGLFQATENGTNLDWDRPANALTDEQILWLFTVPNSSPSTLIAITQPDVSESQYYVYQSTDFCSEFDLVDAISDLTPSEGEGPRRPYDATYVSEESEYWFTVGDKVYSGSTIEELTLASEQPIDSQRYRGVIVSTEGWLYVADENGYIHWMESGETTWNRSRQIIQPGDSNEPLIFTRFTQIGEVILVGTRASTLAQETDKTAGFGFYQFNDGKDLLDYPPKRGPNATSQLYKAHVRGFSQFEEDDITTIFAATAGDGLSSISLSTETPGTDFSSWDWE